MGIIWYYNHYYGNGWWCKGTPNHHTKHEDGFQWRGAKYDSMKFVDKFRHFNSAIALALGRAGDCTRPVLLRPKHTWNPKSPRIGMICCPPDGWILEIVYIICVFYVPAQKETMLENIHSGGQALRSPVSNMSRCLSVVWKKMIARRTCKSVGFLLERNTYKSHKSKSNRKLN